MRKYGTLKITFYSIFSVVVQFLLLASFGNFKFGVLLFSKIRTNFFRPRAMSIQQIQLCF